MTRLIALLSIALCLPGLARAYEAGPVREGGSVRGTVTLRGAPPKTAEATIPADLAAEDRAFCSKHKPLAVPLYAVDGSGRLKDVVVWIEGIAKGKELSTQPRKLVNEQCTFAPLVQAMSVGEELQVENHDPILHNTHPIYLGDSSTLFNLALPTQGQKVKKKVRRPGLVKVQCDAGHTWMRAFVHVFDHPYYVVTGPDGAFSLSDVPPGRYTLKAWHEAGGTLSQEIEIGPGGAVSRDFTFTVGAP